MLMLILSLTKSDKQHLDELVHKLWDLDSIGIKEGDHVHETLIDNIHFTGKRCEVGFPWKVGHGEIPSNYIRVRVRVGVAVGVGVGLLALGLLGLSLGLRLGY